jgi:hypothetical protein
MKRPRFADASHSLSEGLRQITFQTGISIARGEEFEPIEKTPEKEAAQ